ncbi:MAG: hypothetical protein RJQ09_21310 [Cyclobacteriaceae bacterium]
MSESFPGEGGRRPEGVMHDLQTIAKRLKALKPRIPLIIGAEIVSFSLDNFDKQGFHDTIFKRWEGRRENDPGRSLLIGRQSGRGRRSIRILRRSATRVEAGTDLEYMELHNTGGQLKVPVTEKSRKFFWAMWYKTKDGKWRALALTRKKQLTINIPMRRFIGESAALDKRIEKAIENELERVHR